MTTPPAKPSAEYSIDLISRAAGNTRDSVLRVFNYNRNSCVFTPTVLAAGLCEIRIEAIGQEVFQVFAIDGVDCMTVDDTGVVRAGAFTYKVSPRDYPRLEFIRRTSSVRELVGSLTKSGNVSAFRFAEEPLFNTTDRFIFHRSEANPGSVMDTLSAGYPEPEVPPSDPLSVDTDSTVIRGLAGDTYQLRCRFSGVFDEFDYLTGEGGGGDQDPSAPHVIRNRGIVSPTRGDLWYIEVSSPAQRIYLNHGLVEPPTGFDYNFTFEADAGATVTLAFAADNLGGAWNYHGTLELLESNSSLGPKGLLSEGFAATTAGIFETYRVLDADLKRVLTPDGKYLTYPH